MPYIYETRPVGSLLRSYQHVGINRPNPRYTEAVVPQGLDLVYTYRTDVSSRDTVLRTRNLWGVVPPSGSSNLFSYLKDRKRYLEELSNAALSDTGTSSPPGVYSTQDVGHNFESIKLRHTHVPTVRIETLTGSIKSTGVGAAHCINGVPYVNGSLFPEKSRYDVEGFDGPAQIVKRTGFTTDSLSVSDAIQKRLFNNSIPDPAESQLFETLFSLVSGDFPRLWQDFIGFAKKLRKYTKRDLRELHADLGSGYLNIVFGWVPTLSDLEAFVKTLIRLDQILYYSDVERRRRSTGKNTKFSEFKYSPAGNERNPYRGDSVTSNTGHGWLSPTVRLYTTEDYQLSARYSRMKPTVASDDFISRADELLNSDIPNAVRRTGIINDTAWWDIIPFSWLFDWIAHIGQALENYSAFGRRYNVDYAYITRKTNFVVERGVQESTRTHQLDWSSKRAVTVVTHTSRKRASPFGIGVEWPNLSSAQIAILTALGFTKAR